MIFNADKDEQEMRAVAEKPHEPHEAVVKFNTYRNLQGGSRHSPGPPCDSTASCSTYYNRPVNA